MRWPYFLGMALLPTSTIAECVEEYRSTLDYDLESDTAKAKRFIIACRFYLADPVIRTAKDGEELELDPRTVQKQLDVALQWWQAKTRATVNGKSRSVVHADFRNYRE